MSYNTRRGAFRGANQGQALRRPPPQQQQHNFQQMQQQHLRQQAEKYLQNQKPPQQQGNQLIIKQEPAEQPKPLMATKTIPPPAPIISETNAPQATNGGDIPPLIQEEGQPKEKPAWAKGGGKINKKELRRRRNLRLRKMLQPKNALMVLNELVGSTVYDVVEAPDLFSGAVFRCTVKVDGIDHVGLGKSKPSAKNAAAETALKYLVLSKVNKAPVADTPPAPVPETSETEIKMEIDENSEELSWSHVACYALHKLLSSWDEGVGVNLAEKVILSILYSF
uniref:DRBM domain-containing protein n=1 Tax=Photinus pyralis TaxID=7054 RepID=A0A1Y1MGD1_PHOPY